MTADPLRLLQDPATAAVLRRDLGAAARGVPYDASAGLARFEASLSQLAPISVGTGAAVTSARFGGASGPLAVGGLLLIGGLAAVLGWAFAAPEPMSATSTTMTGREVAAAPVLSSPMPIVPEVVAAEAPADVITVPAPVARPMTSTKSRRSKGARNEVSAVKDGADYLREARSLNAARGQLGHDAAQALAQAEAGIGEFKDGTFAQEWEGIAVLALFELGRDDQARARAESFLQRYPSGTYAPRIRQARDEALP